MIDQRALDIIEAHTSKVVFENIKHELTLLPNRTPEPDDVVVWNEPLCLDEGCVVNSVARATKADVIRLWRHQHKEHTYTDEEALADFMAVHWAWLEPAAARGGEE